MKLSFRRSALGVLLGVGAITLFIGKKYIANLFTVAHYTIANDALLTKTTHNQIVSLFATQLKNNHNPKDAALTVQQEIPGIESISLHQLANGLLHITVQAAKPTYLVNDHSIITANHTLAPKTTYLEQTTQLLPAVDIVFNNTPTQEQLVSIKKSLDKLPAHLLSNYQLQRISETESWLRDKEQKKFALIFNDYEFINEKKLTYARYLKNELEQQGKFSGRQPSSWVVDFRFENQIILFAEKRGVSYG